MPTKQESEAEAKDRLPCSASLAARTAFRLKWKSRETDCQFYQIVTLYRRKSYWAPIAIVAESTTLAGMDIMSGTLSPVGAFDGIWKST